MGNDGNTCESEQFSRAARRAANSPQLRWASVIALAIALSACNEEPSAAEKAAQDAADIAKVEAINDSVPPPQQIKLEAITYPDIEKHDLFGAGCNFAPDGGGIGAVFLGMKQTGYFKHEGRIVRLAADAGSPELPLESHEQYDGKEYSAELKIEEGEGEQSGIETVDFAGHLTVRDSSEQPVYEADGVVQCGS